MRKKLFQCFALWAVLCVSATVSAQESPVVLHHNGVQSTYIGVDALKQAYDASADNDTIYLPGGTFNQPEIYTKGLHIYGAGFMPDSTKATLTTVLNDRTFLGIGTDNFHFEGVHFLESVYVGYNKDTLSNISFTACQFDAGVQCGYKNTCPTSNLYFTQCVMTGGGINLQQSKSDFFRNNLFTILTVANSDYNVFENNVIICRENYYEYWFSGNSNLLKNNIYIKASGNLKNLYGRGNSFYNNVNFTIGEDNIICESPYTIAADKIFVNYTDPNFSYEQDYHLQNPETYLGTDGTQVGIYGGEYAWPDNVKAVMPSNPHLRSFENATNTDENGELQINVKVGAQ